MQKPAEAFAKSALSVHQRKARWRDRQRRGVICSCVEVSAIGLDFLIATRWLAEEDAIDPVEIGRAITAMIEDSAKRK